MSLPICLPLEYDGILYRCGRALLMRDPTDQKQACPGGTMICEDCVDAFGDFMDAAYDARARRMEWDNS
jgi:hypothetical protein